MIYSAFPLLLECGGLPLVRHFYADGTYKYDLREESDCAAVISFLRIFSNEPEQTYKTSVTQFYLNPLFPSLSR